MSNQEITRTLSYICPRCRQSVIVEKSLFALAAAPVSVPCPCGGSALEVELLPDKARLRVPCLFCGKEHAVTCAASAFVGNKALAFSCAASGLDCCYVGEEGAVYAATARLEQAVDQLEGKQGEQQVQEMPSLWAISLSSESTSCITSSFRKACSSPCLRSI